MDEEKNCADLRENQVRKKINTLQTANPYKPHKEQQIYVIKKSKQPASKRRRERRSFLNFFQGERPVDNSILFPKSNEKSCIIKQKINYNNSKGILYNNRVEIISQRSHRY